MSFGGFYCAAPPSEYPNQHWNVHDNSKIQLLNQSQVSESRPKTRAHASDKKKLAPETPVSGKKNYAHLELRVLEQSLVVRGDAEGFDGDVQRIRPLLVTG